MSRREATFEAAEGYIEGAVKDQRNITADWQPLQELIAGVELREVKNVCKPGGGVLTEVFRRDWGLDDLPVDQVFQNTLPARGISGWHAHRQTTDRLFVNQGLAKIVLYDAREGSPSLDRINEFCFGEPRPGLVIVPPGIWHAVENLLETPSRVLNLVDVAYVYDDPDHWRLPLDTDRIPYRFPRAGTDPNL